MWTYFLKVVEKVRSYACNYNMGKKRASGADVSLLSPVILIHDCPQFFYSPTHLPEEDMPPSEQQLLYKCFCHRCRGRNRHTRRTIQKHYAEFCGCQVRPTQIFMYIILHCEGVAAVNGQGIYAGYFDITTQTTLIKMPK